MKIDDIWKPQTVQGSPEIQKRGAGGQADDFAALLQGEMSSTGEVASNSGITELAAAGGLTGIPEISGDAEMKDSIAAIEDVIARLQNLEQALQGKVSPKQLDHIIEKIGNAAAKLQEKMDSLPGNHALKDMSEEVKVAAYMESIKWRRGDYL